MYCFSAYFLNIFGKTLETMSIHFFCNTKKSSVNYLCYAISNAFLADSCRILGATSFLLFRVGYECIWECCARIMLV